MIEPFAITITCPHCGQVGELVSESVETPVEKTARILIKPTPGFHQEAGRTRTGEAVIVCDSCDEIQTEKIPLA